jgi:hypothetical protein
MVQMAAAEVGPRLIHVEAQDHLESLARAKPVNALAELVWNALDANADIVRIAIARKHRRGRTANHVTPVFVDDGDRFARVRIGEHDVAGAIQRADCVSHAIV